ncbi:MAG: DUF1905 domain-containing protein [Acidobacteriales bacterium]|nr:DUF1905 domain-containing protein [Terriglobales bacterium]
MAKLKRFKVPLEKGGGNLGWTIIRIPFDVKAEWGSGARTAVRGTINGFPFRTSAFPTKHTGHFMMVNKEMQKGAGACRIGEVVRVEMEPDTGERRVEVPKEMQRALAQDKTLRKYYDALNYSMRKEIVRWVTGVKHAETRVRRAEQLAERLLATMEGEREAPPVLKAALARNPLARAGWEKMPPSHRRRYLLAITYYRSPESRARRVEKCVDQIAEWAAKRRQSQK